MKAVFLDFATLGPGDVDPMPLRRVVPDLTIHQTTPAAAVRERIADAEVVVSNKVRLGREAIAAAPQLGLIGLTATGTDNVDLDAARERGVAVCNIRDYCTQSVVQHVFALVLALTHQLKGYHERLRHGAWAESDAFCLFDFPIRELAGRNLGIVGHGALGRGTARLGEALGMRVLLSERPDATGEPRPGRLPFRDLLAEADVLSLHCPLTPATRRLIDGEALARMKPDALLINTARGALVDASALVEALQKGRLGGAGIDVLEEEPPVNGDPLLEVELGNLIVTPHVAWAAREARQRALDEVAANVADWLAGGRRCRVV